MVIHDYERVFQLIVPTEVLGEVRFGTFFPYIIINPHNILYFAEKDLFIENSCSTEGFNPLNIQV
jgi:hypothetical protein